MKPICPHCKSENDIDGNFEIDYISNSSDNDNDDAITMVVNCNICCHEFEIICQIIEINKF